MTNEMKCNSPTVLISRLENSEVIGTKRTLNENKLSKMETRNEKRERYQVPYIATCTLGVPVPVPGTRYQVLHQVRAVGGTPVLVPVPGTWYLVGWYQVPG